MNIRGLGESFAIFQVGKKRPLGSVDGHRALRECHPGAVYLHKAQTWAVERLDLERHNVWVNPVEPNYFTRIQTEKETEILEILETRQVATFTAHIGRLKVTEHFLGYEKRRLPGQELLGVVPLELPPQIFETVGMWLEIPDQVKKRHLCRPGGHFMGGIHALEHVLISHVPALCPGGPLRHRRHLHHRAPPGGPGGDFHLRRLSRRRGSVRPGLHILEDLLRRTREVTAACPCEDGCPSCIHSPKCGSGNKPLDKEAALEDRRLLLGRKSPAPEPCSGGRTRAAPALPLPPNHIGPVHLAGPPAPGFF